MKLLGVPKEEHIKIMKRFRRKVKTTLSIYRVDNEREVTFKLKRSERKRREEMMKIIKKEKEEEESGC